MAPYHVRVAGVALCLLAGAAAAFAQPGGGNNGAGGQGGVGGEPQQAPPQRPDSTLDASNPAASPDDDKPGFSDPGFAPAEHIKAYVDLLDVDDFAARQNATEFIYQTPSVDLSTVEPYLIDPNLPPETRSRLEAIGDVLFRVTPRAAMGVQFGGRGSPPVVIGHAVADPGFRAHEVIEPGDEIVLADGEPVTGYDDFQSAILSHDPYETMLLRVRRAGELLDVEVTLGDFSRLSSASNLPAEHILRRAWERRLARIRSAATGPLTPVLDLRGAGDGERGADSDRELSDRVREAILVAAGVSRGAVDQSGEALPETPLEMDSIAVEVRDFLRQQGLAEEQIEFEERRLERFLEMYRQLVDRRSRIRENMTLTLRRLEDPDLDPVQRRQFTESLARLEQSLAETQHQIDTVNSVLPIGR